MSNKAVLLIWNTSSKYEHCIKQYHLKLNSKYIIVNSKSFLMTMLDRNTSYNGSIHVVHNNGKAGDTTNFTFNTVKECMYCLSNYNSFKYSSKIFQSFKFIKLLYPF